MAALNLGPGRCDRALAVCFYQSRPSSAAVLRQLRKSGFRRSVSLYRSAEGRLSIDNLGPQGRRLQRGLVQQLSRFVLPQETALVVETSADDRARLLELLRDALGESPATFLLHKEFPQIAETETLLPRPETACVERLVQHALHLAENLSVSNKATIRSHSLRRRLRDTEGTLTVIQRRLSEAAQFQHNIPFAAEWLLDNAHVVASQIANVRRNLPQRYYNELPAITKGPHAGQPRLYVLASQLVCDCDAQLNNESVRAVLEAFQRTSPLTMGELWAMPLLLRLRLLECLMRLVLQVDRRQREGELASFWANRLLNTARSVPDRLESLLADLSLEWPQPSPHFCDQLVGHLHDEETVLVLVRGWIERIFNLPIAEILQQEQRDATSMQTAVANIITSLRHLSEWDWKNVFEAVSPVEMQLRNDPAKVYPLMDFESRDYYRHAVEKIASRSDKSEVDVVRLALGMASHGHDEVTRHVGYYLVDHGRPALECQAQSRVPRSFQLGRWFLAHATAIYLSAIGFVAALVLAAVVSESYRVGTGAVLLSILALLVVLPASELALQIVNFLLTRWLPPRMLPRMSFEDGVPDEARTLVVVPMMLFTPDSIRGEIERLEIRFLGNPDPNLQYALLSDLSDAPRQSMPEDAERLDLAVQGVQQLDARYGPGRFFLFHRNRLWVETEGRWMGWERKRGKLEQLNRFLMGERTPELGMFLRYGNASRLDGIRYVITLDSDTRLPKDTARRLIESLAHPLNTPRLSTDGKRIERGYTILQPRVSTTLPSATATLFSRIFADTTGVDPYTHAVSDVYQDLAGDASYHGKGIYDVAAFHKLLTGRFPPSHLLSHDLIEGAHVRVGFVSGVELFDLFPANYASFSNREHRWVRGDWQIADWLWPKVPDNNGQLVPNPLSLLNRWKIFDNLRRSLVPLSSILFLMVAWLATPAAAIASVSIAAVMLWPSLCQLIDRVMRPGDIGGWRDFGVTLLRNLIGIALLPDRTQRNVDAIVRDLHRQKVSHRLMLEWETAQEAYQRARNRLRQFVWRMALLPVCLALVLVGVMLTHPLAVLPFALLWVLSPLIVMVLDQFARPAVARALPEDDQRMLRQLARHTWRFFDDLVGPQTNWLPPDNFQEKLHVEVAMRTSPTNIGLWLVSAMSAHDFGFITFNVFLDRVKATLQTIDKLERFEGHLLNWYDIGTLAPLRPRYISMVDSGNFLAALWTLERGCEEIVSSPILTPVALRGLSDTLGIVREMAGSVADKDPVLAVPLATLEKLCSTQPATLDDLVRRIRAAVAPAHAIAAALRMESSVEPATTYWAAQVERHVNTWNSFVNDYLSWVEILVSPPVNGLLQISPDAHQWRRNALGVAPSLRGLANGDAPGLRSLMAAHARAEELELSDDLRRWLDALAAAAAPAQALAAQRLSEAETVVRHAAQLGEDINMAYLYDPDRRLFVIGYNVSDRRRDNSYYDLLASEARLGSLVAIARGEIPSEHWWALGRPLGPDRQRPLLSWNGSMFEYLMPLIFHRTYEHSLLDQACRAAVECQIQYAKQRGIPWGISESAYSALDAQQVYQYRGFGVPSLGLKRGLTEDLVVAPYASALALLVAPAEAAQNLRNLQQFGAKGPCGFYDSIDFSRQSDPRGERGVVIYTYMAHHQGMVLLSIANALLDGVIHRRFHSDPRIHAVESVLYERIPEITPIAPAHRVDSPVQPRLRPIAQMIGLGQMDTPDTPVPRTLILSNGTFTTMVTNAGGGFTRWGDFEITRWRADTTCDNWGSFCFLKDVDTGRVWTTIHQPICSTPDRYRVNFSSDKAEFRRRENGIESWTEVVVSPEDNAELRRLTLVNCSRRVRHIEITTFAELALAPHNTDRAHPVFNKLFIRTETEPRFAALLATRRLRSEHESSVWAGHLIAKEASALDGDGGGKFEFETDRLAFIGRGRTAANAVALEGGLTNSVGNVLDPVFSLRRRVAIQPGQTIKFSLVTVAADTRERLLTLLEKYTDHRATDHALRMAWTHAQLELRRLRIHQEDAQQFQYLAGYMLYPHAQLRPPQERLRRNRLGQSRLWSYGISGDIPILTVVVREEYEIERVRQLLVAHSYWRMRGLKVDLVVLSRQGGGYEQPLQDRLARLVQALAPSEVNQVGKVFLLSTAQVPVEDQEFLQNVARGVIVAARGWLRQQLGSPSRPPSAAPLTSLRITEEPSPPLSPISLRFFNGLGGFTADGREYVTSLCAGRASCPVIDAEAESPDQSVGGEFAGARLIDANAPAAVAPHRAGVNTPAPWSNVIANENFGTLVTESGGGFSWCGNSQTNRLTPWSNDPVSDSVGDCIYIRDNDTGAFWTPTSLPVRETEAYRTRHGQGYTIFEHNSHGIEQQLLLFVPTSSNGGDSLRVQRLRLRNASTRRRKLTVTSYVEWTLGANREDTQLHVATQWDGPCQAVFARNAYQSDYGQRIAFAAANERPKAYTGDRSEFLGRNGSVVRPEAMRRSGLSGRLGAGMDPCAALQFSVELAPDQGTELIFLLGQAADVDAARSLVRRYRDPAYVEESLQSTLGYWDKLLTTIEVETPDAAANFMINRWLLYQTLSCRFWGRSAFFQSGGAFGFRDQLQDVLAFLHANPALAREHILRAASRQFVEGDVQHWWHPPAGAGVRTKFSDDLLWLPFVTAHYVRVTRDYAILDEEVPFIEGKLLDTNEVEAFFTPKVSMHTATLLEHCQRALSRGLTHGPHGLPLIGIGDWNDGLSRVGVGGKGESVWLAWFLVQVLYDFAELVHQRGDKSTADNYLNDARKLVDAIETQAWDGAWYRRAYFDDGTPLGSHVNPEARIDSLPQSWAVITGAGDSARAAQALQSAREQLVLDNKQMVLLFTPPFDKWSVDPGYIKGYPPGVRENGGQYTHGALWMAQAYARHGDGDMAARILGWFGPIQRTSTPEGLAQFRLEPYVVAADVYALEGHIGCGGWSWYTGSASWLYRIWIEEVLGFQRRGDNLILAPVLPSDWSRFTLRYRYGRAVYDIEISKPRGVKAKTARIEMDSRPVSNGVIPLRDEDARHQVRVWLSAAQAVAA